VPCLRIWYKEAHPPFLAGNTSTERCDSTGCSQCGARGLAACSIVVISGEKRRNEIYYYGDHQWKGLVWVWGLAFWGMGLRGIDH
jgi:hypothetical protein